MGAFRTRFSRKIALKDEKLQKDIGTPDVSTVQTVARAADGTLSISMGTAFERTEIDPAEVLEAEKKVALHAAKPVEATQVTTVAQKISLEPVVEAKLKVEDEKPPRKNGFFQIIAEQTREFLVQSQLTVTTVVTGTPWVVALKSIFAADARAMALSAVLMGVAGIAALVDTGILKFGKITPVA
jgi:hypothetical protein